MSTYAHREAAQQQRQQQIQAVLKNNQHTLVQMNSDEFIDFMFHIQLLKGKNREQVVEWVDDVFAKKNCSFKGMGTI